MKEKGKTGLSTKEAAHHPNRLFIYLIFWFVVWLNRVFRRPQKGQAV
ncbi:hypothetical protein HMPREF9120_01127 [Neisseria sp. oral taxon 020 str. F0370]|nr:hypothetical protein HMPREF9120_01127 [Neisseria sp. oral taxon 020 str. F0370]